MGSFATTIGVTRRAKGGIFVLERERETSSPSNLFEIYMDEKKLQRK